MTHMLNNTIIRKYMPVLLILKRPLIQFGTMEFCYKLLDNKIGGRFYDLIKNCMYSYTRSAVKISDRTKRLFLLSQRGSARLCFKSQPFLISI